MLGIGGLHGLRHYAPVAVLELYDFASYIVLGGNGAPVRLVTGEYFRFGVMTQFQGVHG